MSQDTIADLAARLDRLPTTAFHHRLALIIAAGLLIDGVDVYITAGVSGALVKHGVATLDQVAHLAMCTTLGLAIGGGVFGMLSDRFGRLRLLWLTIVLVIAGGLLAATAPTFALLLLWRFVTAFGLGGDTVLALGLLIEFVPRAARGRWMAWVALLGALGLPTTLALGHFILPPPDGWRVMLALPALAAIGVMGLRLMLVESARWLAVRGRADEAEAIVARLEAGAAAPLAPVAPQAAATELPAPRFAARFAAAASIQIALMIAVFGFVSWLPTFFASAGQSIAASTLFAGVMTAGAPVGTLIAMTFTDRIERKWGVVACALLAAALGAVYAQASGPTAILVSGFLVVVAIYVLAAIGLQGYVPELFGTAVRMRAIGFVLALGRLAALAVPLAVVPLFKAGGQLAVVAMVAAVLALQALVVALLGPRTRGRSIET